MSVIWNPWHGCHKLSDGCKNCYVYRRDARYNKDSSIVEKTSAFYMPSEFRRDGSPLIPFGEQVFACMTSDFFVEDADKWRDEAWDMIRERNDLSFTIITKRISRFKDCMPSDWGDGYDNVCISCTVENQKYADLRLPIFLEAPIKHKSIICEPLLEQLDISRYLTDDIEEVTVGGESGANARVCDFDWVLGIREQCVDKDVSFYYHQTGAQLLKDGKLYRIDRKQQHRQARKANIDYKARKRD